MDDDLVVEVPPLMFISPVGMNEGEEEEFDEDETSEELTEEDEDEQPDFED
jgi:hypothetical protein